MYLRQHSQHPFNAVHHFRLAPALRAHRGSAAELHPPGLRAMHPTGPTRPRGETVNWLLVAILGYVLVQFAIGAWVSRRMASETDYILAGRRLGVGLITFSVFATYFGAEAIVASGGAVYEKGLTGALVDPVGYATAIILVGVFFARALWSRGLTTFADLFRHRYSAGVEQLVVVVLVPGSVIWAAAQVRAFGQIMSANSGLGLVAAITLAAVLVAAYSVVGGLLADAVTDTIQGVAVVVGLVLLGAIVAAHVGGIPAGLARVEPEQLQLFRADAGLLDTLEQLAIPICGTIVAVELISRFLGARTAQVAGPRHGAWRRDLSADRPHPGIPWADGPAQHRHGAGCGADRAAAGGGFPAGRALRRLRRRHHLGDTVRRSRCTARAGLADLAQHRRAARSRHHGPGQAVVRAPHRDGAQRRRLSALGDFPAHS